MSDPRVTRAAAALTDGHPDTALSLLGTARGFDADLLRIEALQFHDPAGALPAVVRRARKRATTGDEVARLLEVRARPHGGARRESMLHEALELAEAPTLRARLMVDLGHRRLVVTDTDDAERWLRRAEAEGVGSDAVCELEHLRGVIHLHRGQQEEAIAAFSRGLTQAGDRVLATILALRARARCWASLEREADAQSDYERALALTKGRAALREERAKLLNSLADMARLAGDLDGAARRFHALLDMKLPFITPVVHLNLALVEHARGDGARARHHLDQVFVDGTRPFVTLAHAVTDLAVRPSGDEVGERVLAVERAMARANHVDRDTMLTLLEVMPALVDPVHLARIARIVLHHARVLIEPGIRRQAEQALFGADVALVGPYRVAQRLGDGGSATVVRGVHLVTGQEVALKVLVDGASAHRLRAVELDAISTLDHPHLVPLVDHGLVDDTAAVTAGWPPGAPWLATSLVDGGELSRRARWDEVLGWLHDLLDALAHAHARGVLHLDIKPANVLHTRDGQPLLTDFGIAARVGQRRRLRAYTPDFAAPEQLPEHDLPLGPWTDIYGLGATAWAWLVGRPPRYAPDGLDELDLPDEATAWLKQAAVAATAHRFPDVVAAKAALPPRPKPHRSPTTDRRGRVAVRMRRGPDRRGTDGLHGLVDHLVAALGEDSGRVVRVVGPVRSGHRDAVRYVLQQAAQAGRLRVLWVDGDDLRAGMTALLGPTRHLLHRPDVVAAPALRAWLEGTSDDLKAALAGPRPPWVLVRDDATTPFTVPLPRGVVVVDLVEDDTERGRWSGAVRDVGAVLQPWLPELPAEALTTIAEGGRFDEAVDHLRALVALGRIVDTAAGPSLLPGTLPSCREALTAVATGQGEGFVQWLRSSPRPFRPDPVPDDVTPALATLTEWGLARRGIAGWWLSGALCDP